MLNSTKFVVLAMAGAGFAVAATPAHACFDWGYSGVYSYGWPYADTGFASYPAYRYRSCGGRYHIPGWGECGGYGPCGWAPLPAPVVALPVTEPGVVPGERAAADQPPSTVILHAGRRRKAAGAEGYLGR
jgi:hypothetical protein